MTVIYVCLQAHAPQIILHCSPASCLNVSLFAHVQYWSHLHSCTVCIFFNLCIGNHFYICIVKADSRLVVYRFILFYFVLYICIHVAPWSCEARHLVPLYVHTCSGMTIKLNLTWLEQPPLSVMTLCDLPSLWRVSMIIFWTIAKSALFPIIVLSKNKRYPEFILYEWSFIETQM